MTNPFLGVNSFKTGWLSNTRREWVPLLQLGRRAHGSAVSSLAGPSCGGPTPVTPGSRQVWGGSHLWLHRSLGAVWGQRSWDNGLHTQGAQGLWVVTLGSGVPVPPAAALLPGLSRSPAQSLKHTDSLNAPTTEPGERPPWPSGPVPPGFPGVTAPRRDGDAPSSLPAPLPSAPTRGSVLLCSRRPRRLHEQLCELQTPLVTR